uniref:SPT2 chromatin protein n=1 Tax=Manihot esculenta TaxID=3983 RepID=A0A2C9UXT4_MANES
MRGYERDDIEDYDEYEEEGYEQGEEGEEEEYEEEEERKPTAEELEYLELRARIKERIRKKMQRENGSTAVSKSHDIKKKVPSDNYGSFFGPSQPVIAQRVIQESKSFLENPHLASRVTNSHHEKKTSSSTGTGSKNGVHQPLPKVKNELKTKVQKLKDTRDYSFLLSDDAELPAPSKQSIPQTVTAPKSEARSAQVPQKSKQPSGSSVRGSREERKPIPMNGQMHSKLGLHRSVSSSKPASTTMDSRRQLGSNNGSGPGRPTGSKGLPPKMPLSTMEKKSFAPVAKSILPASHKPPAPKMQSSVPRQKVEQKRALPEPKKSVTMPNKPVAPAKKPQINKPDKQLSSRAALQNNRPKKKPARPFSYVEDDEDSKALDMIRQMFK